MSLGLCDGFRRERGVDLVVTVTLDRSSSSVLWASLVVLSLRCRFLCRFCGIWCDPPILRGFEPHIMYRQFLRSISAVRLPRGLASLGFWFEQGPLPWEPQLACDPFLKFAALGTFVVVS